MKTLKSKIKLIVFFLIFISTFLILKNYSKAKTYNDISNILQSTNGYAIDTLEKGDIVKAKDIDDVFEKGRVYCIENGQHYTASSGKPIEYKLSQIINVTQTTNREYAELLYIAKNYNKNNYSGDVKNASDGRWYFHVSSQIAVWAHIAKSDLSKYFTTSGFRENSESVWVYYGIRGKDYNSGAYIDGANYLFPAVYGKSPASVMYGYYGCARKENYPSLSTTKPASNAYKILNEANTNCDNLTGKIYVFTSNNSQNFMVVGNVGEKPRPLRIRIYKRNEDDKPLVGAKFMVTFYQKKSTGILYNKLAEVPLNMTDLAKGTTEYFEPDNTRPIKVVIQEKLAPSGFIKSGDVTLYFSYNVTR